MRVSRFLVAVLLCVLTTASAWGQPALESPEAFLGYRLGDRFTPHHRVMSYFEHVAEAQPNVQLQTYGATYEGRPLVYAVVSSTQNMDRIEEIRTDNLRRTGLVDGAPGEDAVAMVWLSYNVHGNESVSTEAAMQTLYDLADPENARTRAWLEHTVVVLDPCINPDGRERYVNFFRQARGATPNLSADAQEHFEPWPGGRGNHYLFDLNRDWAWQSQQESQVRIRAYNEWMPHVHVDFHEQGVNSPYYFAPAAEPYHAVITDWQREFQVAIGANHARYFDEQGWLYFTREVFDLFYPSYGDTWPTFNGAIGMTYEQAGGGRAGLGIETASGDTLTLADRIAHHHTTGLSTVEIAWQERERLVQEFADFYEQARVDPPGRYKTYVLKRTNDPDRLRAALDLLDWQGVRYGEATGQRVLRGFGYLRGVETQVTVEPGDVIVSAFQPKARLLTALFEPDAALADSVTYDITAWALPYSHNLDAFALTARIDPGPPPSEYAPDGLDSTPERVYAFLAEWKSTDDVRLLAALLGAGVKVRFARRPFTVEDLSYAPGSLIITRADNGALGSGFSERVRTVAAEIGQPVTPVSTGRVAAGSDFGSSNVRFLKKPRVALLSGEGMFSSATGEVWHYFEQQIGYPVTRISTDTFGGIDLDGYDVLILPSGFYGELLNESRRGTVLQWIRNGGKLIAIERAASFLAGKEGFGLKRMEREDDASESADAGDPDEHERALRRYGQRERDNLRDAVQGSVFALDFDHTHPLGFGYADTYFTLKRGSTVFDFLSDGWNVGTLQEDGYRSGFVGADARPHLNKGMLYGVESIGRGSVVYMADNPLYRGFWETGKLLFGNAVFLVGQ